MDSNGKKLLDLITLTLIYNLQLQWTPMGSNGKHNCVQKMMTPSEFSNSNGLQWAPVISNFLIRLLLPIYNLELQWTPIVHITFIRTSVALWSHSKQRQNRRQV